MKNKTKEKEKVVTRDTENETNKEKSKTGKMGNSLEQLHSQTDWGWEDSNEEWEGTIEREKENERKKILKKEKIIKIQTETATKAGKIVGVHPITQRSIDKFNIITGDYNEAKKEAAKEYLINILGFEPEEFEHIDITDTQTSNNSENILYIAFDNKEIVGEIRRRVAERQNSDIFVRDFVPPQFFERFKVLNRLCKEWRSDMNIKTQIRFSNTDLIVLTKTRGSSDPYKIRNLTPEEKRQIPVFDHTIEWKKKTQRPPRRRLEPLVGKVTVPSMQNAEDRSEKNTPKTKLHTDKLVPAVLHPRGRKLILTTWKLTRMTPLVKKASKKTKLTLSKTNTVKNNKTQNESYLHK